MPNFKRIGGGPWKSPDQADDLTWNEPDALVGKLYLSTGLIIIINNNNGRNGSCLTWLATSLEEKRRWLIINASPRGQCSK